MMRDKLWIKGYSNRYDEDVALACVPKGGSMSFRDTLGGNELYSNEEILATPKRVFFVRQPQERHVSTFSFFYKLNGLNQNGQLVNIPKSATHNPDGSPNYHAWVDHILTNDNVHWKAQTALLNGSYNRVYRFNDLDNVWHHFFEKPVSNMNRSILLDTDAYRDDELKVKYADDITLFQSTEKVNSPIFTKPIFTPWF